VVLFLTVSDFEDWSSRANSRPCDRTKVQTGSGSRYGLLLIEETAEESYEHLIAKGGAKVIWKIKAPFT
jgi:hypothetical protein